MASFNILTLVGLKDKQVISANSTFDFLSIRIGSDNLEIKDTAGAFDFSGIDLANTGLVDGRNIATDGTTLDNHVANTSNPHMVTKAQVGLGNVTNDAQLKASDLDTDGTLSADSDTKIPSQKAVKSYVDNQVGASGDFSDSTFRVHDNGDATKKMAFEVSGISASTVRTITMPDANVDLGNLTNSNISASAAIAYSKLNLTGDIVNADINASAAIAYSKLALSNSIVNADINSAAAIAYSKLNLAASVKASDMNSQSATSVQALFADGSGAAAYRSIVSGDLPDLSATYVNVSQKGAANGVVPLDGSQKISAIYLPNSVMELKGAYNASTNTPALADGTGNPGDVWEVTVAGTQDFGSGVITFVVGDWVVYGAAAAKWYHSPGSNDVSSVNGQQGAVTVNAINQLTGGDVTTSAASGSQSKAATIVAGAVTASKLGTVTDGVTLDQSGAGSTLEVKAGGISNTQINASAAIAYSKLALTGSIVNADINASAAIAYSKLALTGNIVNADINASAAIAYSKLNLTTSIVNGDISASAAIAYSKLNLASSIVNADISASAAIAYSKLNLAGNIVNADINASAAIAYSKLALSNSIVNADISSSAAIAYSKLALTNSIVAGDLTANSVTNAKVNTNVFDQVTILGGNGVAASVNYAQSKTNDNAGTITAGQVVYIKSNGNVDLALASTITLDTELAIVQDATIATTASGKVILGRGDIVGGFSGLTPGKKQYVSRSTAGALVDNLTGFVAGEQVYSVGRAISATQIAYNPNFEFEF